MIMPGSIKICSLREVEHARFVLDAGADLFGLIFVPGVRRMVSPERAREIVEAVRTDRSSKNPRAVGVFVDATANQINRITRLVGLDIVQLHGHEPPNLLSQLDAPAIKAVRPGLGASVTDVESIIRRFGNAAHPPIAYLVDGYHESHHGGEGVRADWSLAADLATRWPLMLAGGLTPDNVSDAISAVRPLGVDVSSGVETDGIKDTNKIGAFVANARSGFAFREG